MQRGGIIPSLLEVSGIINREVVIEYIQQRQNVDCGYTFCQGAESNAQDTYYGIEVLDMLGVSPRNVDRTVKFMQNLQRSDGGFSVQVAYYVTSVLSRFGAKLKKPINRFIESLPSLVEKFKGRDVYIEATSELETLRYVVELLKKYGSLRNTVQLQELVLNLQNRDGSFGSGRFSKIASTFYALKILKLLDYNIKGLHGVLQWIRRCEIPAGGFTAEPEMSPEHPRMEDIYYGVKSLELLDEKCRYPRENLRLIARFQNSNGGFRRSIFLGISDFESTYQAVSIVKAIMQQLW